MLISKCLNSHFHIVFVHLQSQNGLGLYVGTFSSIALTWNILVSCQRLKRARKKESEQKSLLCCGYVSCRSSVLLLAPLLAETDQTPHRVSRPTGSAGAQGTDGVCANFRWMAEQVPAFRVPGTHIHILTSPDQFYQAMKVRLSDRCHLSYHASG